MSLLIWLNNGVRRTCTHRRFSTLVGESDPPVEVAPPERLNTEDLRAFHRWGWEGALEQLAAVL